MISPEVDLSPALMGRCMTSVAYVVINAAWDTIDSALLMAVQLQRDDLKPCVRALREAYRRWNKWEQYRFDPDDVRDFDKQKEEVLDYAQDWFGKMTNDVAWDFAKIHNGKERMLVACANMAVIMVVVALTFVRIFEHWAKVEGHGDVFPNGNRLAPQELRHLPTMLAPLRLGVDTGDLPQRARELFNILANEWGFEKIEVEQYKQSV